MADEVVAGRYRLLTPLGRGAMSAVWEAEDEELGRRVAVKMLGPAADRQRFEREARAAAGLSHPNIVSLYDYGEDRGQPYMVLELLPGGSLEDLLASGRPLADADARRVAVDVAAGLAHAHARGLVHRDLKPANILFDAERRAKIADFGIVRVGGGGTLTEAGTVLGTAAYLSPEQATGDPATPASDVYSFGVVVFRMLTGRLPFVSSNAMEIVRMHKEVAAPQVASLRPDAPQSLARLADAALAKSPAVRPPDGAALLLELRGQAAETTQVLRPPARAPRRRPRAFVVVALAAALLAAGAAVAVAVTRGGSGASPSTVQVSSLTLPAVPPQGSATEPVSTTVAVTTAAATTTTRPTTSAPATTAPTTTRPVTTAPATTAPLTTAPTTTAVTTTPTTAPLTTAPQTTTAVVTTAPATSGP